MNETSKSDVPFCRLMPLWSFNCNCRYVTDIKTITLITIICYSPLFINLEMYLEINISHRNPNQVIAMTRSVPCIYI